MKRALVFARRNLIETLRDPLMYIFCAVFPVVLIVLFAVINHYTGGGMAVFEPTSLIPGVIVFSFAFLMMSGALNVSKDRTSSLLIRLYSSPMKTSDFVIGYVVPLFIIGLVQMMLCFVTGAIVAAATGAAYFSFGRLMLVFVASLPALVTFIALGILFGTVFNEKSAPGISSAIISAAGVLGGCWMPLDTMGGFEVFCRFLPFYPSVYLCRTAAGAVHTLGDAYVLSSGDWWAFLSMFLYMAASVALALFAFAKKSHTGR